MLNIIIRWLAQRVIFFGIQSMLIYYETYTVVLLSNNITICNTNHVKLWAQLPATIN